MAHDECGTGENIVIRQGYGGLKVNNDLAGMCQMP
jgi:hypothetical protein